MIARRSTGAAGEVHAAAAHAPADAGSDLRKIILHVGCGMAPLPGQFKAQEWRELRYDIDPAVAPDLVGSMTDMSQLATASVDAVYSAHNLEHLPQHDVQRALAEFLRVLRPGGMAWIILPDVQSLAEQIASGDLDAELYRSPAGPITVVDVLWGHGTAIAAGRHYMAHRTGFSAATLQRRLAEAGFDPVKIERNVAAYELFASAARPLAAEPLEALFQRALRSHAQGRWAEAEALYGQIVERDAAHWPSWLERGVVCHLQGRLEDAKAHTRRALALNPDFARTQIAMGSYLGIEGKPAEAERHLRRAVELDPRSSEAHYNLGKALQEQGDMHGAEHIYREALRLEPRDHLARLNLANVLFAQWRGPEGLPLYREAAAQLSDPYVHSNLPMLLNFAASPTDAEVFEAHLEYDRRLIAPLAARAAPHGNDRDPQRRLRIGYLSRDFCRHSVRYFLVPVFAHHDRQRFEISCYHLSDREDEITAFYRRRADHWVDCQKLDDEALAARIRADGIDILVDLAGYTDRNRLLVLGRKPAPVQISYLGYPATTGVRTIDYRISDRWIDPEPPALPIASSETPLRLAHGYFCYSPVPNSPAVGPLPLDRNGHVTFGSLNQAPKLNRALFECWAEILRRLPGSRLVIQNKPMHDGAPRAAVDAEFERLGIAAERIDFRSFGLAPAYLRTYHEVDIALDSFPYNGGTTTCEALWMGVPVVSQCGGRHVSRLGASILNQLGLGELVTDSAAACVDAAAALAQDPPRLRTLRSTMRERMLRSPLMDHAGFTRELEGTYREVWQRWCRGDAGLQR